MNLADIRKKAQTANSEVQWGPKPPSSLDPLAAPPVQEPETVAFDDEPLTPGEPPELLEFGQEFRELEPPWIPPLPEEGLRYPAEIRDEPYVPFDPVGLILRGRETSSAMEEELLGEEPVAATIELLCFKVAHEEYAIDIMRIKEIIKPREVTEVPRVPAFVRGILSLRGNIIPVFDMRARLGMPEGTPSEQERIVVVNRQGGFCGILVDQVVQVVRIPEAGIEPPPVVLEGIDRDFVQGIGQLPGGRMVILLDMEQVLDVTLA
jgi:purine-binding chemotaxis protein CheW